MPTYDYQCGDCGHRFERFQKMSDPPVRTCPECGGKVSRLIGTGAAVLFKGGGSRGAGDGGFRPGCGRDRPCCGRETPCDTRPCDQ
jgi:putative FmdB family regulatory protein